MINRINSILAGIFVTLMTISPSLSYGQSEKEFINKYLKRLSPVPISQTIQRYNMTAIYTNRDLYGNFIGKEKIIGEYTMGLENGFVCWNNVYYSDSKEFSDNFPTGAKQEYMEDMKYIPSEKMLDAHAFKDFPLTTESVYAKNLIWDMMAIEGFAWNYSDSLQLNKSFTIPEVKGEFTMADIGTYSHQEIQLCWSGISTMDNKLFAIIEYRAIDNKVAMEMEGFKTRGTEQYWGTIWISLENRLIGKAVMYGGIIQEIEIAGSENKFLTKTIRELWVNKIQ